MQRQGWGSQETLVQPWEQGPGSSSRDIHNNIFELYWRTKTPNKWKMLVNSLLKHSSFQKECHSLITSGTTELIRRPSEARLKECRPWTHPNLYQQPHPRTIAINTHQIPPGWDIEILRARPPCVPLCLAKQQSYSFLLHPKLSLRFNLAFLHRGRVLASISCE